MGRARNALARFRGDVVQRQEQRERAALPDRALEAQLAAEEAGDLATDREAKAGAAVLARRAASACWNASNTMRCLSDEMPMPVSMTSNATTVAA